MSLDERVKYAQMKSRHRKKLRAWYLKPWGIIILIIAAIFISLLIASAIYIVKTAKEYNRQSFVEDQKRLAREYEEAILGDYNNQSFGPATAPITIVQFSDFACPFCANSADIVLAVKNLYPENVRFIHRDFPLHANSVDLALSAHCAGEQNNYWGFYEQLFAQQDRFSSLEEEDLALELTTLSGELNLDPTQFAICLHDKNNLPIIANDFQDSEYLRLEGTPVWFINNHQVVGYVPLDSFLALIDTLLADF